MRSIGPEKNGTTMVGSCIHNGNTNTVFNNLNHPIFFKYMSNTNYRGIKSLYSISIWYLFIEIALSHFIGCTTETFIGKSFPTKVTKLQAREILTQFYWELSLNLSGKKRDHFIFDLYQNKATSQWQNILGSEKSTSFANSSDKHKT